MSKVFSAKQKTVGIDYEFIDGKVVQIEVSSVSTKEQLEVSQMPKNNEKEIVEALKVIIEKRLKTNDKQIVKAIINEMYEYGDIDEFAQSLNTIIEDTKAGKSQG